jgi:signal transduction histidine kinase
MESPPPQPDPSTVFPFAPRVRSARFLGMRTGLESKLLLSFTGIFAMAVGMSCFLILQQQRATVAAMIETQAVSLSRGLAAAVPIALERNDPAELSRLASRLKTQRDVIGTGIFGVSGRLLASSGTAPNASELVGSLPGPSQQVGAFDPINCFAPGTGTFLAVTSPVLSLTPNEEHAVTDAHVQGFHVVGYVTVCISEAAADAEIEAARLKVVLVGTLTVLACIPVAAMLIHKLLDPIRCLVAATQRISAGDLGAQVAVDRQDVIGVLARSFNQMVLRVREHQEDLARANRELESKVLERTAQLETANKRLSSEIAEKEEFLRAVSHDLNAPLRNISGMAEMLMRKRAALDADVIHRLERIQKNVEVETNLIGELLELSRIKTQRLKMEEIDTRLLVEEIAGTFEADLRMREIHLFIDNPLPNLRCERARIRQVFQNLIDNAIKYMGESTATPREIHVGCKLRTDEAEFHVRDTGIGIEERDRDRIFQIFRRGTNARSVGIPGKGIGLASVKSIVETYSGSIWAESTAGKGSTFRFTVNGEYVIRVDAAQAA